MSGRRAGLGGLLVAVAGLATAWAAGAFSPRERAAPSVAPIETPTRPAGADAGADLRVAEPPVRAPSPPPPSGGNPAETEELTSLLDALRTELALPKERAGEDDTARDEGHARRRALLQALREKARHLDGAWALIARLETEVDANTALRIGRALRSSLHPEIGAALADKAVSSSSPLVRRAALAGLEMRPPDTWWEAVRHAYEQDADGDVRDEAANVLARSLVDRTQRTRRDDARQVLLAGLAGDDADQRLRTLTALMIDTQPRPDEVDAVRALLQDPDERVRREAAATLRVFER